MGRNFKRIIDKDFRAKMKSSGAVQVVGPKFCGKTTFCNNYCKSDIALDNESSIAAAKLSPNGVLSGAKPRLIDEWQTVPDLWNYIKKNLDKDYQFGKFILTGSATPVNKEQIRHSGAGRITSIEMRPLTLYESKESIGKISLLNLIKGNRDDFFYDDNNIKLEDIAFYMCRGGWPISVLIRKRENAILATRNYFKGLFAYENTSNDFLKRKKRLILQKIIKSWARNISTQASKDTIITDISKSNGSMVDYKTYDLYVETLKDLYIIYDLEAWSPNIRSKTAIRTSPTHHFIDTSIALAALNINPNDLLKNLESFGLFFEDFVLRDLFVYSQSLDAELTHYRDAAGSECDCVVHLPNGKWIPIEIKLGGEDAIDEAIAKLRLLRNKIVTKSSLSKPEFMMVITAVGVSYKTDDDIYVVPITMLKP